MEVKTIEEIKTLEHLTAAVEYYEETNNEIIRLGLSRKIAEQRILEQFKGTGLSFYDTPSGLRARNLTYVLGGKLHDRLVVYPIKAEGKNA